MKGVRNHKTFCFAWPANAVEHKHQWPVKKLGSWKDISLAICSARSKKGVTNRCCYQLRRPTNQWFSPDFWLFFWASFDDLVWPAAFFCCCSCCFSKEILELSLTIFYAWGSRRNPGYSCVVLSYAIQKHQQEMISRWWFQSEKNHPYLGKIPNLTNIFQMGWNHQLGDDLFFLNDGR